MSDYIRREDALMAVCSADLPDKTEDGTPILNGKRKVSDCVRRIKAIPAANVRPVVLCRDCMMRQYCKVAQYLGADGFCSNGEKRES